MAELAELRERVMELQTKDSHTPQELAELDMLRSRVLDFQVLPSNPFPSLPSLFPSPTNPLPPPAHPSSSTAYRAVIVLCYNVSNLCTPHVCLAAL